MALNQDNTGVPVFDPIEAYSMTVDENEDAPHSQINSDVSNTLTGVVDLTPIQTAGLSLTPVGPPTSIQIQPSREEHTSDLLNVPSEFGNYANVANLSRGHVEMNSVQKPLNFGLHAARLPPPDYPGSNYDFGPPPSYEDYLNTRSGHQQNLNMYQPPVQPHYSQTSPVGKQNLIPFPRHPIIPGAEPRFTKVVSGDKTIVYSQAVRPQISPGSSPSLSPNSSLTASPGKRTPAVSPKPSPRKNCDVIVNQEFSDIPGVNLRKSNVDLNVYVNSLVPYCHPTFMNIDSYAERCLTCIVRKLRNNLPSLQNLIRTVQRRGSDPMTECILIQRNKDCRITVARQSGPGTTSSKRIHPHLALVQIFVNPQAQNVNLLEPLNICRSPYNPGLNTGEICINPHHYNVVPPSTKTVVNKSPVSARKSPVKPRSAKKLNLDQNPLLQYLKAQERQEEDDSDSDFLSDTSDSVDWEDQWRNNSKVPNQIQPQQASEDDLLNEIKFMTLKRTESTIEASEASPRVLENLKIIDDLRCLFRGKFDLSFIQKSGVSRPRAKTRMHLAKQRAKYEKSEVSEIKALNPTTESRDLSNFLAVGSTQVKVEPVSDPSTEPVPDAPIPAIFSVTGNAHSEFEENLGVKIKEEVIEEDSQDQEYTEDKRKKDDLVIQNLLENIKDSFETDLDMDLETFTHDDEEFADQGFQQFSIANTFSMSGFRESTSQDNGEDMRTDEPYDASSLENSHNGTSDALLGGPGSMEGDDTFPFIVNSWTVAEGEPSANWNDSESDAFMYDQ